MTDTTTATGAFPMPGKRSDYRLFGALDGKPGLVVVGPATRVVKEGEALRFTDGTYVVRGDDLIAENAADTAPREITEEEWLSLARDYFDRKWVNALSDTAEDAMYRGALTACRIACRERGIK